MPWGGVPRLHQTGPRTGDRDDDKAPPHGDAGAECDLSPRSNDVGSTPDSGHPVDVKTLPVMTHRRHANSSICSSNAEHGSSKWEQVSTNLRP